MSNKTLEFTNKNIITFCRSKTFPKSTLKKINLAPLFVTLLFGEQSDCCICSEQVKFCREISCNKFVGLKRCRTIQSTIVLYSFFQLWSFFNYEVRITTCFLDMMFFLSSSLGVSAASYFSLLFMSVVA